MANLALTLSCGSSPTTTVLHKRKRSMGVYECKTCQRHFPSFQALGGHRTSHKRPRARAQGLEFVLSSGKKTKTSHECAVCGAEFALGQALGGHMRRHKTAMDLAHDDDDEIEFGAGAAVDWVHGERPQCTQLLPLFV